MKRLLTLFLILNTVFLSGCWDMRELNELGMVMMVGVDKGPNNSGFLVTVQIAKGKGQGGGQGNTGGGEATWVASADGSTIFEAVRNIARFSSRRIMWAHNNVIVIGEDLAREDITPVIDFFTHNPELRMKTWVGIARGKASEYVSVKTGMEDIPGIAVAELFRYNQLPSISTQTDMLRLYSDFLSDSIQPIVSAFRKREKMPGEGRNQVELSGGAVFKGTRMLGWLTPEEIRGISWVRGETKSTVLSVSNISASDKKVAVEIRNIKVKTNSEIINGSPIINIDFKAEGHIAEEDFISNMSISEMKSKVEKETERQVKRYITQGIDRVQKEYKSDVLGFGRRVHIEHKYEWDRSIKSKWEDIYPNTEAKVNVHIDLRSSILYQQPIKQEKQSGGLSE